MTQGKRIKKLRIENKMSQVELAKLSESSKQTIYKYENEIVTNIPYDKLILIARALKTTPGYILGWEEEQMPSNIFPIKKKTFPMLGNVACGEPIYADEERGVSVDADADIHADFCLRCAGESMTGDGINDGDIVFIRKQPMVDNGEIACVIIDDEATLKHFYGDGSQVTLAASNSAFAPMVFRESDCKNIKILGKAVAFTRIL